MATFYLDDYGVLLAWTIDGLHVDRSNASGALYFLLVVLWLLTVACAVLLCLKADDKCYAFV